MTKMLKLHKYLDARGSAPDVVEWA